MSERAKGAADALLVHATQMVAKGAYQPLISDDTTCHNPR
jgi:hypothetical protein